MAYTDDEIKELMLALMPPGFERWADVTPGGDLDLLLAALAEELNLDGYGRADALVREINPASSTSGAGSAEDGNGGLASWETALGLQRTAFAQRGADDQRRGQILARLREHGNPIAARIEAALLPVIGSASAFEIRTHSRGDVTSANKVVIPATVWAAPSTTNINLVYADNALTGLAGAMLSIAIDHPSPADISLLITAPTGPTFSIPGTLFPDATPRMFWWRDYAGDDQNGLWILQVFDGGVAGGQIMAGGYLLVEGIGKDWGTGAEGRGGAMFEWAVLVDTSLAASTYDPAVAREVARRWNPAHCRVYLAQRNALGDPYAIFDDPLTPFDAGLFAP